MKRRPPRPAFIAALAVLLSLAVLQLASCRKEGEPAAPPPSSDSSENGAVPVNSDGEIIYSETFEVGGTSLFAMASFPRTGLRAIDDYYEAEAERFKAAASALAEELRDTEAPSYPPLEYSARGEIVRDGGVFSVRREIYTYTGGAHSGGDTVCDNFRLPGGERLSLDDVFTVPREEYTERLLAFFDTFIDSNPEPFFPDAKETLREGFPYERFCAADGGLEFYFPPYIIGPYSSGTIVVPVPSGEIADIADPAIFPRENTSK